MENILVWWLRCLTAKQMTWVQSLFCQQLHENERIWILGGGPPVFGTSPWIPQYLKLLSQVKQSRTSPTQRVLWIVENTYKGDLCMLSKCHSGSSSQVGEWPRNIKSMWPPLVAIFFMAYLYSGEESMAYIISNISELVSIPIDNLSKHMLFCSK